MAGERKEGGFSMGEKLARVARAEGGWGGGGGGGAAAGAVGAVYPGALVAPSSGLLAGKGRWRHRGRTGAG